MGSPPDAGKTTLLNADVRSMGSYVTKATADTFLKPRGYAANPSAHNDGKAKLDSPARRTFIEELASPFNTEMANELSGGGIDQDYRAVGEKRRPYVRVSHMVFVYNIKEGDQTPDAHGRYLGRRCSRTPSLRLPPAPDPADQPEPRHARSSQRPAVQTGLRGAHGAAGQSLPHRPRPHPRTTPRLPDHAGEQIHASSQAKPAVERDFIPNIFVQRQNDEQPAADSYTAYQLYLEWRKDEGETGPPITKTSSPKNSRSATAQPAGVRKTCKEKNAPHRRLVSGTSLTLDQTPG